jgi:endonuclease YncB( thermonuclease family)
MPHPPAPRALLLALLALLGTCGLLAAHVARAEDPPRVEVPVEKIRVDDGDSLQIAWPEGNETVRLLGVDAPETIHLEHEIPHAQPFGEEAAGFLRGCLAVAERVELLRAAGKDPYGRTLGYVFVNGRNTSVLLLEARLAVETVSRYGDNGLPELAAACVAAAGRAGAVPFEDPHLYRARMRTVARRMKAEGTYPATGAGR